MKKTARLLLTCFSVFLGINAHAATFCVSDSNDLLIALATAETNGEDDEIRLLSNVYNNASSGFSFNNSENQDLSISGGWSNLGNAQCVVQNGSAHNTVFDANFLVPNLVIDMGIGGNLTISDLSFVNGQTLVTSGTESRGSGLRILGVSNSTTETIRIERNIFQGNEAEFSSALFVNSPNGLIEIRNNVFEGNNSFGSGFGNIYIGASDQGIHFINNTIINNTVDQEFSNLTSGLRVFIQDSASVILVNNNFWNNDALDFLLIKASSNTGSSYVYNNNYESTAVNPMIDFELDNISLVPQLEGSGVFSYTPSLTSPLRNAGMMTMTPVENEFDTQWDYGSGDLIRSARVKDGWVDIGAVEAPAEVSIFRNGFE